MAPTVSKILVPTDFSEGADAALAYAKSLAGCLGASLHLLHVFTDLNAAVGYTPEAYIPVSLEARERAINDARAHLEERLDADEEIYFRGTREIVTGLTAKQIVKYATDEGIGLIVMGTHGRRGFSHLFLGSVAEHVVRTAPCPVLTVRDTVGHEKTTDLAAASAKRVA
jgi:nucleotide-binding universal stress UspA family protein